jgi:hypothetical protein
MSSAQIKRQIEQQISEWIGESKRTKVIV